MLWRTADPSAGNSATFERATTDVRFTKTLLTADAAGMVMDLTGYGISEAPSLGTETVASETNQPFSPYSGAFSALWDGGQLEGLALSHKLNIDQGLYKDEKKLHTWGRADFPPNGTDIYGDLTGVDMAASVYRSINWGSLYGSAPSALIPEAALDFSWTTGANMPACSVPYKLPRAGAHGAGLPGRQRGGQRRRPDPPGLALGDAGRGRRGRAADHGHADQPPRGVHGDVRHATDR